MTQMARSSAPSATAAGHHPAAREVTLESLMQRWACENARTKYLLPVAKHQFGFLFAVTASGTGHFAVINEDGTFGNLDRCAYRTIADEAKRAGVTGRLHVHAAIATYTGSNIVLHKTSDPSCAPITFSSHHP